MDAAAARTLPPLAFDAPAAGRARSRPARRAPRRRRRWSGKGTRVKADPDGRTLLARAEASRGAVRWTLPRPPGSPRRGRHAPCPWSAARPRPGGSSPRKRPRENARGCPAFQECQSAAREVVSVAAARPRLPVPTPPAPSESGTGWCSRWRAAPAVARRRRAPNRRPAIAAHAP